MHSRILLPLLLLVGGAVLAAEMYQWKDRNGQRQFGDRPPIDAVDVKRLTAGEGTVPPSDPVSENGQDKVRRMSKVLEEERLDRARQKAEKQQQKDKRAFDCQRAQQALREFEESAYRYDRDEKGEIYTLTPEQDAALEQQLRANVEAVCTRE